MTVSLNLRQKNNFSLATFITNLMYGFRSFKNCVLIIIQYSTIIFHITAFFFQLIGMGYALYLQNSIRKENRQLP